METDRILNALEECHHDLLNTFGVDILISHPSLVTILNVMEYEIAKLSDEVTDYE